MGALERIARAIHGHQIVSEITRDPDPAPTHAYQRSPQSGAGNCVCGVAERHRRHPHAFMAGWKTPDICTCGLPSGARAHQVYRPGSDRGGDDR